MRSPFATLLVAAAFFAFAPAAMGISLPTKDEPAEDAAATDAAAITDPLLEGADVERGKAVYQRIGLCINCHGWNGNGMGKNPRSEGDAALLRDTQLDTQGLMDVIRCGVPSTPMPYHSTAAYRDPEVCFGMTLADFDAETMPEKGKTFRDKDLVNLVAYLQTAIVGKGETTLEECEAFFEPGSRNCANLRD